MGTLICEYLKNSTSIVGLDIVKHEVYPTYESLNEIKEVDLIIDFSSIDSYNFLVEGIKRRIPIFSGTTGYTPKQIQTLMDLAKENDSIFVWKPNYSKGINLFIKILKEFNQDFKKLDFVEIHEKTKKDTPSGTAIMLADILGVSNDYIQSLRLNYTPVIHELIFYSDYERITITHEIFDKKAFILGLMEEINKSME